MLRGGGPAGPRAEWRAVPLLLRRSSSAEPSPDNESEKPRQEGILQTIACQTISLVLTTVFSVYALEATGIRDFTERFLGPSLSRKLW